MPEASSSSYGSVPLILFLYHRAPAFCAGQVRHLRRLNPGVPIYGLYGGEPAAFSDFDRRLTPLLDGNWCFDEPQSAEWRWMHYDRMILAWVRAVGQGVPGWTHLLIHQWDMLMHLPVQALAGQLGSRTAMMALFPYTLDVLRAEPWYWYTQPCFAEFYDYVGRTFVGRAEEVYGQPLVFALVPRPFFDEAATYLLDCPGTVEMRLPTFLHLLGFTMVPCAENLSHLHCDPTASYDADQVASQLALPDGARLFHPVREDFWLHEARRRHPLGRLRRWLQARVAVAPVP